MIKDFNGPAKNARFSVIPDTTLLPKVQDLGDTIPPSVIPGTWFTSDTIPPSVIPGTWYTAYPYVAICDNSTVKATYISMNTIPFLLDTMVEINRRPLPPPGDKDDSATKKKCRRLRMYERLYAYSDYWTIATITHSERFAYTYYYLLPTFPRVF